MAQPGKIDRVYEEIIKMEDRFSQLESNQWVHFEQYIEKASASIIAELKRQISQLTEKIDLAQERGKRKIEETKREPNREILKLGWHPENLEIEENSLLKEKMIKKKFEEYFENTKSSVR